MKVMEFFFKSVLILGLIVVTTQKMERQTDITGRKNCDCSICKGTDNKINPILGKKISEDNGGKSSCNICEHKKRMLQEERERQEKLQKCPFEILGSKNIKDKTSDEVFDEFRELVIPSQNGFFDMMRGVVKTIHVSSEQELKWAKEKEAKELAKKKEEEARREKEPKHTQDDLVGLGSPVNPKVTVVLKQTPCGQIIPQVEKPELELETLMKRLPKDANGDFSAANENEILQRLDLMPDFIANDANPEKFLLDMDLNENLLNPDVLQQLIEYDLWNAKISQEKITESTTIPTEYYEMREEENDITSATESPYVKFMTNEELKAQSSKVRSEDDSSLILGSLSTDHDVTAETENFSESIKYTTDPTVPE